MNNKIKERLKEIIENEELTTLFQPIVCIDTPRIYGYEALIRGPSDSPLHSPLQLFNAAVEHGLLTSLELVCRRVSILKFAQLKLPGRLFLNISPMVFLNSDHPEGKTLSYLKEASLSPDKVVIELSEKYPIDNTSLLSQALKHYRNMGLKIAVDDLGTGYAGLKLWSEVKPDYVKIDRYFINEIQNDPIKREFVRSIIGIGASINAHVIAEGVETEQEFNELNELGISMSQGYFFARPSALPETDIPPCITKKQAAQRLISHFEKKACSLFQKVNTADYLDSTGTIVDFFHKHPLVYSVPVLRDEKPVGLMIREHILELFSQPYGRSLNTKKPVTETMMSNPVIVDSDTNLEEIAKLLTTNDDEKLMTHFIITHKGKYLGIGSVRDLLRQLTQQQLQHASYANPLTLMPGNVPIYRHIDKLISKKIPFHIAYLDLNSFKPYNDVYGYSKGDEIIQLVANLLQTHCKHSDFIGHIGGDDFVAIFTREDWQDCCEDIIKRFDEQIPSYYKKEDIVQGGIQAKARNGEIQHWPLLGLAIGVAYPDLNLNPTHHDVAELASNAKKLAKSNQTSSLFICRRRGPTTTEPNSEVA